jgi:hypothetical protein
MSGRFLAALLVWVFLHLGSRDKPLPTDEVRGLLTKAK